MKKISYITIFLLTVLLVGCTADEEIIYRHPSLLSVTVTDEGFSSGEKTTATRTTDVEYTTTFAKDDRIGIFAVADDGVILDNNIPYVYDGSNWVPVDTGNTIHNYNYAGVTYYAYYPYSAVMDDAASEQAIIGKFTPLQDQSTQANYTASDLMTGAGTVSDAGTDAPKLTLALKHRMSLIVVDIKSNSYVTSGGYQYTEPIDGLSLLITVGSTGVSTEKLYHSSTSMYRYLIPAGIAISVSVGYNAGKDNTAYSYATSIGQTAEGKYHLINMQRGENIVRNLKVGDFYYQDGSILPGEAAFYNLASNPCIGIVFKVGAGNKDNISNYDGKLTAIHGYVVSLDQASRSWGDKSKGWTGTSWYEYWAYPYTKLLLEGMAQGYSFPGCQWCVEHTPVPTGVTSGWHFPSYNPVIDFVDNATNLNTYLNKVGGTSISGDYLTATESSDRANKFLMRRTGSSSNFSSDKSWNHNVRAILTF